MTTPDRRPSVHDLPIPENSPVDDSWPEVMVEIAAFIGPFDTLRLVDALGGTNVRIAREPRADSRVARAIGLEAARRFGRAFAGSKFNLPNASRALIRARVRPVLARVRAGELSMQEAALLTRLTRECISRYLKRGYDRLHGDPAAQHDERQLDMFRTRADAA